METRFMTSSFASTATHQGIKFKLKYASSLQTKLLIFLIEQCETHFLPTERWDLRSVPNMVFRFRYPFVVLFANWAIMDLVFQPL